eukprot:PRCOL_00005913-RA
MADLETTLRAAASVGASLGTETRAALATSLPLKRAEAGLATLSLVGKVLAASGSDYLLAQGSVEGGYMFEDKSVVTTKLFYSIDAVKWMELEAAAPSTQENAAKITVSFTGDVTHVYTVRQPKPVVEDSGDAAEEGFEEFEVSELDRLAATAEALASAVGDVAPVGAVVLNATDNFVANKLFSGVAHPDKLDSYMHLSQGPASGPNAPNSLAKDTRGSWAVQYDAFSRTATLRSLLWPGFVFFLNNDSGAYGSLYVGSGMKNEDLPFMI